MIWIRDVSVHHDRHVSGSITDWGWISASRLLTGPGARRSSGHSSRHGSRACRVRGCVHASMQSSSNRSSSGDCGPNHCRGYSRPVLNGSIAGCLLSLGLRVNLSRSSPFALNDFPLSLHNPASILLLQFLELLYPPFRNRLLPSFKLIEKGVQPSPKRMHLRGNDILHLRHHIAGEARIGLSHRISSSWVIGHSQSSPTMIEVGPRLL